MRAHPRLYEISAWPWLERLSRRENRYITLADVPPAQCVTQIVEHLVSPVSGAARGRSETDVDVAVVTSGFHS
jgi:hypothetical protein